MTDVRISITGGEELERKCGPDLYAPSIRRVLTKTAIQGENLGKERSPVDKGPLRASIAHEVDTSDPPTWARYGTNRRYGLYLNSPVTRNPHYRRGPRAGASTKDWLTGTLPEIATFAQNEIAKEIKKVESAWSS